MDKYVNLPYFDVFFIFVISVKPQITLSVNVTRKLREHDYVRFSCEAKANPSVITWK